MVEVTFPIQAETLRRIDALCEACKPVKMTREKMLRRMVQTAILYWESSSEAGSVEEATMGMAPDLAHASLAAVLLYGLTLNDDDPAVGVLRGVGHELALITSLGECTPLGTDFDFTELVPVLEGIGRRIEVVLELMTRARWARTTGEPVAPEPGPARDGDLDGTGGGHERD